MGETEEERLKREDKERKKAEVRKRLEEASKAKKAQTKGKGFMTPERKKKLRFLLRKKAADELKKEQDRKATERKNTIESRCGKPKAVDGANEATLQAVCKEYYSRITKLEDAKYDLESIVRQKDYEINELNIQVNDLRGKFVKPALRKVSKYEQKFAKLQKASKAMEHDFRSSLKQTKKFTIEEEEIGSKAKAKPEWALGAKGEEGGAERAKTVEREIVEESHHEEHHEEHHEYHEESHHEVEVGGDEEEE